MLVLSVGVEIVAVVDNDGAIWIMSINSNVNWTERIKLRNLRRRFSLLLGPRLDFAAVNCVWIILVISKRPKVVFDRQQGFLLALQYNKSTLIPISIPLLVSM